MIPEFKSKPELFTWLRANKHLLITAKKSAIKYADPVIFSPFTIGKNGLVVKSEPEEQEMKKEFSVKVVINTTNIRDSHKDVHLPGIWKKSLSETRGLYLIQEHKLSFDHMISDRVQGSTKKMTWKELGFDWPGETEALIFDAVIEPDRCEKMAENYAKGRVKNHSVGMIYVKCELAMNSDAKFDVTEKEIWDKYIDQIVNKDEVMEDGYFFAVTEAKVIEGSAVPIGSNYVTPTISIEETPGKAVADTSPEPLFGLKFLTN